MHCRAANWMGSAHKSCFLRIVITDTIITDDKIHRSSRSFLSSERQFSNFRPRSICADYYRTNALISIDKSSSDGAILVEYNILQFVIVLRICQLLES
jgi:hypothetical protein